MSSTIGSATSAAYTPPAAPVSQPVRLAGADGDGDNDGSKVAAAALAAATAPAKAITGTVGTVINTSA